MLIALSGLPGAGKTTMHGNWPCVLLAVHVRVWLSSVATFALAVQPSNALAEGGRG
jgi:broad-specificity NMP kinase